MAFRQPFQSPLGVIDPSQWVPSVKPEPQSNAIVAGLKSGFYDMVPGLTGSALQWGGVVSGMPSLEQFGKGMADSAAQRSAAVGRADLEVTPWSEEGGGWSKALPWLGYQAAKQAPLIAAQMVAGRFVPSGMVPAALERVGAAAPRFLGGGAGLAEEAAAAAGKTFARDVTGAAAVGVVPAIGSLQQEVSAREAAGGEKQTRAEAVGMGLAALPYAALDAINPAQLKGLGRGVAAGAEGGVKGIVKNVMSAGAASAIEEVAQEATQTAIEQSFRSDLPLAEKARNVVDAALTGGAVGGLFGGMAGGVGHMVRQSTRVDANDMTEQDLDAITASVAQKAPAAPAGNVGEIATDTDAPEVAGLPGVSATPNDLADSAPPEGASDLVEAASQVQIADAAPATPDMRKVFADIAGPGGRNLSLIKNMPEGISEVEAVAKLLDAFEAPGRTTRSEQKLFKEFAIADASGQAFDFDKQLTKLNKDLARFETKAETNPGAAKRVGEIKERIGHIELMRKLQDEANAFRAARNDATATAPTPSAPSEFVGEAEVSPETAAILSTIAPDRGVTTDSGVAPEAPALKPATVSLTDEAQSLIDAPGAPSSITRNLRRVAQENGVEVTRDMRPQDVIDALRAKRDVTTPSVEAAPAPAPASPEPAPAPAAPAAPTAKPDWKEQSRLFEEQKRATEMKVAEMNAAGRTAREISVALGGSMKPAQVREMIDAQTRARADAEERAMMTAGEGTDLQPGQTVTRTNTSVYKAQPSTEVGKGPQFRVFPKFAAPEGLGGKTENFLETAKNSWMYEQKAGTQPERLTDPQILSLAEELANMRKKQPRVATEGLRHTTYFRDQDITEMVKEGGSFKHVSTYLGWVSEDPAHKQLLAAIKRNGVNPKIVFKAKADPKDFGTDVSRLKLEGAYDPNNDTIELYTSNNLERLVLHEATHAATVNAIDVNTPAAQKMTELYEIARENVGYSKKDAFGLSNVKEFVAEAFSNPEFRQILREMPAGRMSLWERFKEAVFKLLKLPTSTRRMLDEVLEVGDELMDENSRLSPEDIARIDDTLRGKSTSVSRDNGVMQGVSSYASKMLERINASSFDSIKQSLRPSLLAVTSWLHAAENYGYMWDAYKRDGDVNALEKYSFGNEHRATAKARLAGLFGDVDSQIAKLPEKAQKQLSKLMEYTAWQIDPRKNWDQHTWLKKDTKNLARNEQRVAQANEDLRKLNQMTSGEGGKVYEAAVAHNELHRYAGMAVALHNEMARDLSLATDPVLAETPMLKFIQQPSLHNNVVDAKEFWHNELLSRLNRADAHVRERMEAAGKIKADNPKEAEQISQGIGPIQELASKTHRILHEMEMSPYFHLGRTGEFAVSFHLKREDLGDGKKGDPDEALGALVDEAFHKAGLNVEIRPDLGTANVFLRFETKAEAEKAYQLATKLAAKGLLDTDKDIWRGERGDAEPSRNINIKWLDRASETIADSFKELEGMSEAEKKQIREDRARAVSNFRRMMLEVMPDTSLAKVLVRRDFVPGYNQDMIRSFAYRAHLGTNALANMSAAPEISEAMRDMREGIDRAKREPSNDNVYTMQQVYSEAVKREDERSYLPQNGFLEAARAINHAYFLGFSPSYVMVNMTQIGTLLWPELAKHGGYMEAARALARVTPTAFRILAETFKEGKAISAKRAADATITESAIQKAMGSGTAAQHIMDVVNRGNVDIGSASRELGRRADGRADSKTDTALRFASSFGYYSEAFTRLVAALSVYEMQKGKLSGEALDNYTDKVINQTMLNYSQWNTARVLGKKSPLFGPMSPLMFSFMNYQLQVLEKLYREFDTAVAGRNPADKKAARRFIGGHMAAMLMISGSLGLPFATAVAGAIDRMRDLFGDDDGEDIREQWRDYLAATFGKDVGEVLARGLPRAVGFDISQRAGEQDLLPFSKLLADKRQWNDAIKEWALGMAGAPLSMVNNIVSGGGQMMQGNFIEGAKSIVPAFMKGPMDAYRMTEKGYTDKNGNALPVSVGARDIMWQFLGLQPANKAEYQEQRRYATAQREVLMREAKNIRMNLAKAIEGNDADAQAQWQEEASRFDQANPDYAVLPKLGSTLSKRAKSRAMAEATHTPIGFTSKTGQRGSDWANWEN